MLELEQSIEPSSWSLLTISDCNLCALLSMVHTPESTKALLTQLTGVLDQNVQRASLLEEAIEMNNNGLPEDMFKDTRSRKTKLVSNAVTSASTAGGGGGGVNKKDMVPNLQAAMSNLFCDAQSQEESLSTNNMSVDLGGTTDASPSLGSAANTPTSSNGTAVSSNVTSVSLGSGQNADVLNVLTKSPHIIVCHPKQGSLSYILTVPTVSSSSSPAGAPAPGRRILPSPGGAGLEGGGISSRLVGFIKKTAERGKSSSRKSDKPGGRNHQNGSSVSSEVTKDYDAEKFSQFANILVNMDGIGGLRSTVDVRENTISSNHNNHHHHHHHNQQQQQQQRGGTHSLTSSGSDAEFTDSIESTNSDTAHQMEAVEVRPDELMDFASIVSSAVGSNSEATRKNLSPSLSLPPAVPMSWLEMPHPNSHQTDSGQLPQVHSDDSSTSSTTTITSVTTSVTTADMGDMSHDISPDAPSSTNSVTTLETNVPPTSQLLVQCSGGNNTSLVDHESSVSTQIQVEITDQPMTDAEPPSDSQDTSHDFLDVSLDLDAESLQQLLALSHSPESHHSKSSTSQQAQLAATSTDTASPLSPISQLFDRLEPPVVTPPGDLSLRDPSVPCTPAITTQGDLCLTGPQVPTTSLEQRPENTNYSHIAIKNTQTSNIEPRQLLTLDSQNDMGTCSSFGVSIGASHQLVAPSVGGDEAVSCSWTPSPNSLQLWLESTASELQLYTHYSRPQGRGKGEGGLH